MSHRGVPSRGRSAARPGVPAPLPGTTRPAPDRPAAFKDNSGDGWWVFVDEADGRSYLPFHTDSLAEPDWSPASNYRLPSRPRHGTVLPVTAAELAQVRAAFPNS